jgi:hypothetical protein
MSGIEGKVIIVVLLRSLAEMWFIIVTRNEELQNGDSGIGYQILNLIKA